MMKFVWIIVLTIGGWVFMAAAEPFLDAAPLLCQVGPGCGTKRARAVIALMQTLDARHDIPSMPGMSGYDPKTGWFTASGRTPPDVALIQERHKQQPRRL